MNSQIPPNGTTASQPTEYRFPTSSEQFRTYIESALGPGTILIAGVNAALAQSRNDPPEWTEDVGGYARRFASAYSERFIANTAVYGLGEALHEDTFYHKCNCAGVMHRFGHVLKESYTARTESGRTILSFPALVGPYVGGWAASAWYPDRFGWKDRVLSGTGILISRPLLGLLREFLP